MSRRGGTEGNNLLDAQQLAQIVNAIQPLINPQQLPQPPAQFSLTPYGRVLDPLSKRDGDLYSQAIKKFEPQFDGQLIHLQSFVDKVKQRAAHLQCSGIYDLTMGQMTMNLFERYTTISQSDMTAAAVLRWAQPTWAKQASYIMGVVIMESLDDSFRTRVIDKKSEYLITDENEQKTDGPLLMKTIYGLVSPETTYTSLALFQEIAALSPMDHGNDLIKLHHAFRLLVQRIHASSTGSQAMPEELQRFYLMQAYEKVRCDAFRDFIKQIKNDTLPGLELLIQRSEAKFQDFTKTGEWTAVPKDEQLLALHLKTQQLERENQKLAKKKEEVKKGKKAAKRVVKDNSGFQVYADADFSGGFDKSNPEDPSTAKSRSAYSVMYNGCLICAYSKLQTEIALSTTEAEYVCLSQSLRTVIVLIRFFKELSKRIKAFKYTKPNFHCKAFEDNNGALALAQAPSMKPRTKHINLKYHHFKSAVKRGLITLEKIATEEQIADIGTKPLNRKAFEYLRKKLMGW